MSSHITLKISTKAILVLGGSITNEQGIFKSKRVFKFNPETENLFEEDPMEKEVLSIYPGFVDSGRLIMVDEDASEDHPTIVHHSVMRFLPGLAAKNSSK